MCLSAVVFCMTERGKQLGWFQWNLSCRAIIGCSTCSSKSKSVECHTKPTASSKIGPKLHLLPLSSSCLSHVSDAVEGWKTVGEFLSIWSQTERFCDFTVEESGGCSCMRWTLLFVTKWCRPILMICHSIIDNKRRQCSIELRPGHCLATAKNLQNG